MINLNDKLIEKSGIKFICINSKNQDVISLFLEALDSQTYMLDEDYCVILFDNSEIDIRDIVDSINVDTDLLVRVYESSRVYSKEDFNELYELAKADLANKAYINNIDLIKKLGENAKNYKNLFLGRICFSDDMKQFITLFLENDLNASLSAKNGFMHRNTINYKLTQIKDETGLDIRRFKDAVAIYELLK